MSFGGEMRVLERGRLAWLLVFVLAGCAALPKHVERPVSKSLLDTRQTALGHLVAPAVDSHPGESGFLLYNTADGAIRARMALADVAQSSIDAQYFMWASDRLGRALLAHVLAAADRGVRVRLLIDDYHDAGRDLALATLDAHPNVEVRVFNPFVRGRLRLPQFIGRFAELNRRMHNKLFIVDGQAAIVGGRNITDDYFGLGHEIDFRDFDLLAIGQVVPHAAWGFDRYWNSRWAYPITALRKRARAEDYRRGRERFDARVASERATFPYAQPRDAAEAMSWLEHFRGQVVWGQAEVIFDDPDRMGGAAGPGSDAVGNKLRALAEQARREIVIENAYLIPNKELPGLRKLVKRGVHLRLLTNSLASTDEVMVNAHYAKARTAMVDLGISLYEMKPWAASRILYIAQPTRPAHLSLHGKAAVIDREIVFLGSFNLDPRSLRLDTEVAYVVYSEALAQQLLEAFATDFEPANAWHIGRVTGKKDAAWLSEWPDGRVDVEPHDPAELGRRIQRSFARILPIGSLL
jgi:putative cardiolipin synthase